MIWLWFAVGFSLGLNVILWCIVMGHRRELNALHCRVFVEGLYKEGMEEAQRNVHH